MLIVTNRIQVKEDFVDQFAERMRDGQQEEVPGRLYFARLKADEPGVYINMSAWVDRDAFDTWRGSENFKRAHSGRTAGAASGPPQITIAEVIYSEGGITAAEGA